jgi:succinate dehydrogenase / fumarate reductase, flavoprotein subunit
VFGRRAGLGAADYIAAGNHATSLNQDEVNTVISEAVAPFEHADGENPYTVFHDLQDLMQADVGIIRTASELEEAKEKLEEFTTRVKNISVKGARAYNPGWNLTTDLPAMITVCKTVTLGAIMRKESRGGHTREDFPNPDPELGKINFAQHSDGGNWDSPVVVEESPILILPPELKALLEEAH